MHRDLTGTMTDEPTGRSALWACGVLGKVHGLRGEFYLNLAPDGFRRLRSGERFYLAGPGAGDALLPCELLQVRGTEGRPLVRLDRASTRDEALGLQGLELLASGGALDEEPHYRVGDLLGLRVETAAGAYLGEVVDVFETPANEVLEVRTPQGKTLLLPLVDEVVTLYQATGSLQVIDGFVDEPESEAGR